MNRKQAWSIKSSLAVRITSLVEGEPLSLQARPRLSLRCTALPLAWPLMRSAGAMGIETAGVGLHLPMDFPRASSGKIDAAKTELNP
jgi:hypothetical protein